MEMLLSVVKNVVKLGKSLSVYIPSDMARHLGITDDTVFYACLDASNRCIVYTMMPSIDAFDRCTRIKARVAVQCGDKKYYVLTVPAEYARMLGIGIRTRALLACRGRELLLRPL